MTNMQAGKESCPKCQMTKNHLECELFSDVLEGYWYSTMRNKPQMETVTETIVVIKRPS